MGHIGDTRHIGGMRPIGDMRYIGDMRHFGDMRHIGDMPLVSEICPAKGISGMHISRHTSLAQRLILISIVDEGRSVTGPAGADSDALAGQKHRPRRRGESSTGFMGFRSALFYVEK